MSLDEPTPGAADEPAPADSPFAAEARPGGPSGSAPDAGPGVPRRRWWRRGRFPGTAPATAEKKPGKPKRSHGRRQSAVDDLEDLFIGAGPVVGRMFGLPATGRVVSMNASVDAVIIDEAVANTPLDRIALQPIVRNRKRVEGVLSVLETPLIMATIERNPTPENIDRWYPSLYRAVRRALPIMVPAMVKVRKREAELETAARDLYGEELGIPEFDAAGQRVDPVAWIVRDFLSPLIDQASANGPGSVAGAPTQEAKV